MKRIKSYNLIIYYSLMYSYSKGRVPRPYIYTILLCFAILIFLYLSPEKKQRKKSKKEKRKEIKGSVPPWKEKNIDRKESYHGG